MSNHVRLAERRDVPEISKLLENHFASSAYSEFFYSKVKVLGKLQAAMLDLNNYLVGVFDIGGEIKGTVVAHKVYSKVGKTTLAMCIALCGEGKGEMLEILEEWARDVGCKHIQINEQFPGFRITEQVFMKRL